MTSCGRVGEVVTNTGGQSRQGIRNRALSPWDERHHREALASRHRRAHRPGSYPDDDLAQIPRRQNAKHTKWHVERSHYQDWPQPNRPPDPGRRDLFERYWP